MRPILAAFVGNSSIFGVLLVLHVMGAIIGLGPTFTFGLLGALGKKQPPEGGLALMEGVMAIETKIANPILMTVQPLTGLLLIWNRGLNDRFFSGERAWLIVSILAYIAAFLIALRVVDPALEKMIKLGKAGQGGSPEFAALSSVPQKFGPVLGVLGIAIIVLMVWKPGSGPACAPFYRC